MIDGTILLHILAKIDVLIKGIIALEEKNNIKISYANSTKGIQVYVINTSIDEIIYTYTFLHICLSDTKELELEISHQDNYYNCQLNFIVDNDKESEEFNLNN